MKSVACENCGGNSFREEGRYLICCYCDSRFLRQLETVSRISLDDDVAMLLEKCQNDPKNARRYASLILDIDPTNIEAKKLL